MPPLSKMLPLVVMMGLNKFDLEAMGLRQHCGRAGRGTCSRASQDAYILNSKLASGDSVAVAWTRARCTLA